MTEKIEIHVPEPNLKTVKLELVGTNNLLMHRFSEKARKMILDKQTKKANKARAARKPREEFENSIYLIKKGKFKYAGKENSFPMEVEFSGKIGIPALWIKQSIISACRQVDDLPMTLVRGTVFVNGEKATGLIPVEYETLQIREDVVRIGRGTSDLRYRAELLDWKVEASITFNADVLSLEQMVNLLKISGFSSGIGEWRPERSGDFGTYAVETTK